MNYDDFAILYFPGIKEVLVRASYTAFQGFRFHDMKELITSMALRLAHTAAKQEHGPEILHESARCPRRPLVSFVPSASKGCSSQHAGSSRPFQ